MTRYAQIALLAGLAAVPAGPGRAGTATVLAAASYAATDGNAGGRSGTLARDGSGTIYATAEFGGANNLGEVYQLTPPSSGSGPWTRTTLYSFTGGSDGAYPVGGVVMGANGVLYGVTSGDEVALTSVLLPGMVPGQQEGSRLYALTPSGNGYTESTIVDFGYFSASGRLAIDASGAMYGSLQHGGGAVTGGIFRVAPNANASGSSTVAAGWQYSMLYTFGDQTVGAYPQGGVTFGGDGKLYGSTSMGGDLTCHDGQGCGVVFRLSPQAAAPWPLSIVQVFHGNATGDRPAGPLLVDTTGNILGTTSFGGVSSNACTQGCGTVFSLSSKGGTKILYSFCATRAQLRANCADGMTPAAGLMRAADGHFYGTATLGGSSDRAGTVFRIDPFGGFAVVATLSASIGGEPSSPLAQLASGSVAGTTTGGAGKPASVYAVSP